MDDSDVMTVRWECGTVMSVTREADDMTIRWEGGW